MDHVGDRAVSSIQMAVVLIPNTTRKRKEGKRMTNMPPAYSKAH